MDQKHKCNIDYCEECQKLNPQDKLISIDACADGKYGEEKCCRKKVCKDGCEFILKCNHIIKVSPYNLEKKRIRLECVEEHCNHSEIKDLRWWGIDNSEWKKIYD